VDLPATRYAKSGDLSIAFQTVGEGPPDLVYIPVGFHHVELTWEFHTRARFLHRLAAISRLVRFDKRGTGMSDRMDALPTLELRMDDVRAVMDAASSDRAILFGTADGGFLAALFAATYPERTSAVVFFNARPRQVRSPDMPWLRTRTDLEPRA
jgi:pimeloyl-ACP methyl ester carboxylesterase